MAGKTDMERIGIFQEMGYVSIGDRYKTKGVQFNTSAGKGKQMLPGGSKERSALQAGYFDNKFQRILEGEAYSDPIKLRRLNRLNEAKKNIGKAFFPSNTGKRPSGLGNHYGTFAGAIGAFSPISKGRSQSATHSRNFVTNPSKKGTGYGYLSVTIGPYYKHETDPFDNPRRIMKKENESHKAALKGAAFKLNMHPKAYFDSNPYATDKPLGPKKEEPKRIPVNPFKPSSPGKSPAGMKAGTFDPYPSHSADPYKVLRNTRAVNIVNKTGKTFMPTPGPKSTPVTSIVNQNVQRSINSQNYRSYTTLSAF
ncbi:cilia-and flagella-associated protein 96-like isoform X1 [Liolophura sinensis]|uniref:cilia-and flagella-associated protein 96-like isoform X1 n=1 Tax=Liolophura sinensis TaxID=3198878 RepID=UPI003157F3BE